MSHNNTIRYWRQRQKRVLIHFIVLSLQQRIHIIAYTYVCNFKFMEFRWNLRESCCEFLEISFPFLWWRWNMDFSWGKIFIWSGQCIYGVMMHFLVLENICFVNEFFLLEKISKSLIDESFSVHFMLKFTSHNSSYSFYNSNY